MSRFFETGGAIYPSVADEFDYGPLTQGQYEQGYRATQEAYWEGNDRAARGFAGDVHEKMAAAYPDYHGRCVVEMGDIIDNVRPTLI